VQLVRLAKAVVAAGDSEPRVDVCVQGGDGGGVQVLVVDQEDVIVRVPAILVTAGELQRVDVAGDSETALEPLPGRTLSDVLPGGPLCVNQPAERISRVVRDGDRDQAGRVPGRFPDFQGFTEFGGAAVVDLAEQTGYSQTSPLVSRPQ